MKQLILLGYEFITVMLPSVAVILVFRLCRGKEQNRFHKEHLIGCLIFRVTFLPYCILPVPGRSMMGSDMALIPN